jgi:hypothetical protein
MKVKETISGQNTDNVRRNLVLGALAPAPGQTSSSLRFQGLLIVWLADGSLLETPFWDRMYATVSIAAVPEEFWNDLKPEDFA